ncbi:MAG: HEAT repeat domain-containing protein [Acidobacteriota bacterium]|nr:HEAT repeat domain-containing protein [Acidobacteriota bacterium]
MDENFRRLYGQLLAEEISTSQFLRELKSVPDYSDYLLAAMDEQRRLRNLPAISKLIWGVADAPSRKFTPLMCDLLDHHRYDGYMEAIADLLFDIGDERAVPSLIRALSYHVEGDSSHQFNRKLIYALNRIGTPAAIEGIRSAAQSPHALIREAANEVLRGKRIR